MWGVLSFETLGKNGAWRQKKRPTACGDRALGDYSPCCYRNSGFKHILFLRCLFYLKKAMEPAWK